MQVGGGAARHPHLVSQWALLLSKSPRFFPPPFASAHRITKWLHRNVKGCSGYGFMAVRFVREDGAVSDEDRYAVVAAQHASSSI